MIPNIFGIFRVWDIQHTDEVDSPYLIVPVIWINSLIVDSQKVIK